MANMAFQPAPRRRFQFRLRTLMIVMAVATVWVWGARQLFDSIGEGRRQWLLAHRLPPDSAFPAPDRLLIDPGIVASVMWLALVVGIFLILRGRTNRK
jgi:hypothetical protein